MKLLLVYLPFCTPTTMPYSLAHLKGFLQEQFSSVKNLDVKCLDLNIKFHHLKFPQFYEQLSLLKQKKEQTEKSKEEYYQFLQKFDEASRPVYAENHKRVLHEQLPEYFSELLNSILQEKPDLVSFSLVYNSQCFYAKVLLDALTKAGMKCVLGGPGANFRGKENYLILKNALELKKYLITEYKLKSNLKAELNFDVPPDFSDFRKEDYLSKELILPLKSSSTCSYQQCTFCTHFAHEPYYEYNLTHLKKAILQTGAKHVFFIDDMISAKRLLELAKILEPLKVKWWCQLRPTKDLIPLFPQLACGGMTAVGWGFESASQRILDAIKKGTKVEDISLVFKAAHQVGIKNIAYTIFGFPTETKEEFLQTIEFLKAQTENISLVTVSMFGLQKGSQLYAQPEKFGIAQIIEQERTILEDKITFQVVSGMSPQEAARLRKRYTKTIDHINKLPKVCNYFKEQILLWE